MPELDVSWVCCGEWPQCGPGLVELLGGARAILCDRIFYGDDSVPHFHCPVWQPAATLGYQVTETWLV